MRDSVCLLMISVAACGGTSQKRESAAACSASWHELIWPKAWDVTSGLIYDGGTLYYGSANAHAIIAQPVDGSPDRVFAAVPTLELWIEGDHLLFSQGSQSVQIGSVPLAGGTPQLVLDGGAGRPSTGFATAHAFTSTDFYWSEAPFPLEEANPQTTLWHQSRSGGLPEQLGAITFQHLAIGEAIALGDGTLLTGALSGEAYALPITGGPASPLASLADLFIEQLVGLDALGAYLSVFRSGNEPSPLMLAPADGSPAKDFWPTMPADALVNNIWPTREGGWVIVATQFFDDDLIHTTMTLLDSQGIATRLGCSPGTSSQTWIVTPVAVAPEAVYAATLNLDSTTWEIDRIDR